MLGERDGGFSFPEALEPAQPHQEQAYGHAMQVQLFATPSGGNYHGVFANQSFLHSISLTSSIPVGSHKVSGCKQKPAVECGHMSPTIGHSRLEYVDNPDAEDVASFSHLLHCSVVYHQTAQVALFATIGHEIISDGEPAGPT